jgi:hypothetical protein
VKSKCWHKIDILLYEINCLLGVLVYCKLMVFVKENENNTN